ncbi:MAG: plastocyanin/azurin family copper-binding protein [Thermosynechococcaceae cyanobacterium]
MARHLQNFTINSILFSSILFGVVQQSLAATQIVNIPGEDRFSPYNLVIHVGDVVKWVNTDTDSHKIISDDSFTTTDHKGIDVLIKGTLANGGKPGTFKLLFKKAGTFVYYCGFHAKLDGSSQPVAPGPFGGIKVKNNFGTPMTGNITVLP